MEKQLLYDLLNVATVVGNEEAGQEIALDYGKEWADQQLTDAVGNTISVVNPEADFKVLLCGHMDEIGFRVTNITDAGLIQVQEAGGVRPKLYIGAPMQIIHETEEDGKIVRHKVPGVGVTSPVMLKNADFETKDILIDIGASSKEEAAAVVAIGDSVCGDTEVRELLGENFTCRALDDKTGVFVILEAVKKAKAAGAKIGLYANAAVGEETTCRGAYFASATIKPDCAVIVDVTFASDAPDFPASRSGEVKLGKGPVLCHSGVTNKKLNRLMAEIAKEKDIPIQWEVSGGRTYTDGDTVQQTVSGVPFTLISIPLRYMHSSVEVGNWQDLAWCIDLIAEFLVRIDKEFDFRPIKA